MDRHAALIAANEAFYRAFDQRDLAAMDRVWAGRREDVCIHPGWEMCRGRAEIRASWTGLFANGEKLRFHLGEVSAEVLGDAGRVSCIENIWSPDGRALLGRVAATNLFVWLDGGWRMVLHHGSPIAGGGMEQPVGDMDN
jgi:ketosteroid isomerase-like protein